MRLIVQPDEGAAPLIRAIRNARKSVDAVIFRFDLAPIEKALKAAVGRGVAVRALIAHTNRGGEKELRKLERRLLKAGVTVARTDDELIRYHGKLLIIDGRRLFVMGFNYTEDDIQKSRSFGVVTRSRRLIADAARLIEADSNRQNFKPSPRGLVVSPENARQRLSRFIRKTKRELLIYDPNVADDEMLQLMKTRANAGVRVRILGKVEKKWSDAGFKIRKFPGRLHVRALVRDGRRAFVGSQSLRKPELDERREVGIVIRDARLVKRLANVFVADWTRAKKGGKKKKKRRK
jgi:cardiolipin synthase A/B